MKRRQPPILSILYFVQNLYTLFEEIRTKNRLRDKQEQKFFYIEQDVEYRDVPMKDDPIALVLDDLLKLDDILACMVARRNMISVMPSSGEFKPEVNQIWDVIHLAMDDVFSVIGQYSGTGLGEMEFRLQDFEVLFYVFPERENALVAIVPALANKGLLEVELENARREILKILDEQEKTGEVSVPA